RKNGNPAQGIHGASPSPGIGCAPRRRRRLPGVTGRTPCGRESSDMTNGSLWRRVPGAGLILLASGLLPAVAVAGEALARLTLELEVSGREQSVNVAGR